MPASYNQLLTKGVKSSLSTTEIEDGKIRFVTDAAELYIDDGDEGSGGVRIKVTDIIDTYTEQQLSTILVPLPKVYLTTDTHKMYVYSSATSTWYDISAIDLTAVAGSENTDEVVWISPTNDANPKYASGLAYNPSTQTFKSPKSKIGDMLVYTETDSITGDQTAHFELISNE